MFVHKMLEVFTTMVEQFFSKDTLLSSFLMPWTRLLQNVPPPPDEKWWPDQLVFNRSFQDDRLANYVSETQFKISIEELEVYLSKEEGFRKYLQREAYESWSSQENSNDRIEATKEEDISETADVNTANMKRRQRDLRTVLGIIGKCVSMGHNDAVVRHATSKQWVYDILRLDYDIQQKGINFFNILDLQYDETIVTPIAFYNQYIIMARVSNNFAWRRVNVIKHYNNLRLQKDEKMTLMLEDLVLLNIIKEIDTRLPAFVRSHYTIKISKTNKLMDFKNDTMNNIPTILKDLEKEENLNFMKGEISSSFCLFRGSHGGQVRGFSSGRCQPGRQNSRSQNQEMYC